MTDRTANRMANQTTAFSLPGLALAVALTALPTFPAEIALQADKASGKDNVWQKRAAVGKPSWGIKGSGNSLSGSMWFDAFPGASGKYRVELGAVLEFDGQPEYKVSAGGKTLKSGSYPYSMGSRQCDVSKGKDKAVHLDLGTHEIKQGDKIEVWGKSVYPCGAHGAYTRWWEVRFTSVGTTTAIRQPSREAAFLSNQPWNPAGFSALGGSRDALGRELRGGGTATPDERPVR